jgi:hypothetical protein
MTDSSYSEGTYVGPSSGILATIVATDPVEVSFGIPDRLMSDLRFGVKGSPLPQGRTDSLVAWVKVNGEHLYKIPGKVTYIAPLVDKSTATIKVKTAFPNPDSILVPGESVTVVLEDGLPRKTVLIPKNSIMQSSSIGSFVYVPVPNPDGSGDIAEIRPITTGLEFPEGMEVLSGLSKGDKVVNLGLMSGGAMLRPGRPIKVVDDYIPISLGDPGEEGDIRLPDTEAKGGSSPNAILAGTPDNLNVAPLDADSTDSTGAPVVSPEETSSSGMRLNGSSSVDSDLTSDVTPNAQAE